MFIIFFMIKYLLITIFDLIVAYFNVCGGRGEGVESWQQVCWVKPLIIFLDLREFQCSDVDIAFWSR